MEKTVPGPGQYCHINKKNSKGVLFGNTKRFKLDLSSGTNKYYDISQSFQRNNVEN